MLCPLCGICFRLILNNTDVWAMGMVECEQEDVLRVLLSFTLCKYFGIQVLFFRCCKFSIQTITNSLHIFLAYCIHWEAIFWNRSTWKFEWFRDNVIVYFTHTMFSDLKTTKKGTICKHCFMPFRGAKSSHGIEFDAHVQSFQKSLNLTPVSKSCHRIQIYSIGVNLGTKLCLPKIQLQFLHIAPSDFFFKWCILFCVSCCLMTWYVSRWMGNSHV